MIRKLVSSEHFLFPPSFDAILTSTLLLPRYAQAMLRSVSTRSGGVPPRR